MSERPTIDDFLKWVPEQAKGHAGDEERILRMAKAIEAVVQKGMPIYEVDYRAAALAAFEQAVK